MVVMVMVVVVSVVMVMVLVMVMMVVSSCYVCTHLDALVVCEYKIRCNHRDLRGEGWE